MVTKSTRNTGKPWTKDDVKELKQLARRNPQTLALASHPQASWNREKVAPKRA